MTECGLIVICRQGRERYGEAQLEGLTKEIELLKQDPRKDLVILGSGSIVWVCIKQRFIDEYGSSSVASSRVADSPFSQRDG